MTTINVRFEHTEVLDFHFSSDVCMAMFRMRTISCPFIRCRFFLGFIIPACVVHCIRSFGIILYICFVSVCVMSNFVMFRPLCFLYYPIFILVYKELRIVIALLHLNYFIVTLRTVY